jgi:hypothetical protein
MAPARYQHLRRLELLGADLRRASVERQDAAEIIARCGVADLHRFFAEFWEPYREMPPIPHALRPIVKGQVIADFVIVRLLVRCSHSLRIGGYRCELFACSS